MAYTSLIEEPTPSTSLMSHIAKESSVVALPATIPKPARMTTNAPINSLQNAPVNVRRYIVEPSHEEGHLNILPLPPRTTKPKLVDKPRHIRKYPLKLLEEPKPTTSYQLEQVGQTQPNIYQNTKNAEGEKDGEPSSADVAQENDDVVDSPSKVDTNPFNTVAEPTVNPFGDFFQHESVGVQTDIESGDEGNKALVKERKDHVSVEDLLEFADQKPCGRQRGEESDEVRIMVKVLKEQADQAQCLEALELSGWNVHNAIKLVRVKVSVPSEVTFDKCHEELQKTNGDIAKAVSSFQRLNRS